jgi:hypothetical protein
MQPTMTEYVDGTKEWAVAGKIHRLDGPAVEYRNGDKEWWVNDNLHRTDGPALIYAEGTVCWYWRGREFSFDGWLRRNNELTEEEKVMMKLQYG